ncbi:carbohydrate ABC transporter permease [Actinokineospora soli]
MTAIATRPARTAAAPPKRRSTGRTGSRLGLAAKYAVVLAFTAFSLIPLLWMVSAAFKAPEDVLEVPVRWIPREWHPENFVKALLEPRFTGHTFLEFLINSTVVASVTAIASVVLSIMVGYGFAKFRFRGREAFMWTLLGSTLLPFSSVVIPLYLIIDRMALTDTLAGLIIPFVITGQAIFIARQFIRAIPTAYIEAARLDGASEWVVFRHIIVPLAGPAVTTVAVMSFLFSWNQFLWPLVITSAQEGFTAPLGLSMLGMGSTFNTDYSVWMAAATLAVIPPLVFFLIFERPYLRGLEAMAGIK